MTTVQNRSSRPKHLFRSNRTLPAILLLASAVGGAGIAAAQPVPGVDSSAVIKPLRFWGGGAFAAHDAGMLGASLELGISRDGWLIAIVGTSSDLLMVRSLLSNQPDDVTSSGGLLIGRAIDTRWLHASVAVGTSTWRTRTFQRNTGECFLWCGGEWRESDRGSGLAVRGQLLGKLYVVGVGVQFMATGARGGAFSIGPVFQLGKLW